MNKAKLTITVTLEREQHAENYPPGSTQEEMLAIDLESAKDDPYIVMEADGAKWSITIEPITEEKVKCGM